MVSQTRRALSRQARWCTYNVTVRHVRATIFVVEKQWALHNLSVCICSLSYPACIAHVPYCHLWPKWLYYIFLNYLTNGSIFEKKLLNTKCVFWFPLQLSSETFLIPRRTEWDMIKNVCRSSGTILMKREFSPQFFEKYSNIKFHENLSSGIQVVPCGWTDGQTWQN
jgi:hypothetical protein